MDISSLNRSPISGRLVPHTFCQYAGPTARRRTELNRTPIMSAQHRSLQEQLIGTWALVQCAVLAPDGTSGPLVVGSNPAGQYIFTEDGHFSFQAVAEIEKFLSNDRMMTTSGEDKMAVQGSIAYFGTYTVSETDRTIAVHIERSSFPNQNGTDGKRVITALTADEMSYINPGRRGGGFITCTYRRAK